MHMEFNGRMIFNKNEGESTSGSLSWYEALERAATAYTFDLVATRLMEKVIVRIKVPSEIRNQFVEDLLEMRSVKFQSHPWEKLSNILAHYVAQDDSFANSDVGIWRAPCGKLEYSYFSNRMDRYIAEENYLKETSLEYADFIEKDYSPNFESIDESMVEMIIEEAVRDASLTPIAYSIWKANKIEGKSVRDLAKEFTMSKTRIGVILKDASEAVEASYWKINK